MNYAQLVKKCRDVSKDSQESLAVKMYVDRSLISKIENGKHIPSYDFMKRLGEVTGCSDLIASDISGSRDTLELARFKLAFKMFNSIMETEEIGV